MLVSEKVSFKWNIVQVKEYCCLLSVEYVQLELFQPKSRDDLTPWSWWEEHNLPVHNSMPQVHIAMSHGILIQLTLSQRDSNGAVFTSGKPRVGFAGLLLVPGLCGQRLPDPARLPNRVTLRAHH